ncbi:unnamed protein product [Ilex paraguariensis]|uniref:TPX2 C-terminal domain-containing protein n=1 Tax=Ilex paraguariensis TaxID=185542 RepID=A0ABC8TJF4_9AQUA
MDVFVLLLYHFLPPNFQKLEEKFNSKEEQKVQLQPKLEEKAETELRKLHQNFCFKARPLPDFYRERETPKTPINKTRLTQPQSPKLGRKPSASTMYGTISPHPTFLSKKIASTSVFKKKSRTLTLSPPHQKSLCPKNTSSSNIQH